MVLVESKVDREVVARPTLPAKHAAVLTVLTETVPVGREVVLSRPILHAKRITLRRVIGFFRSQKIE